MPSNTSTSSSTVSAAAAGVGSRTTSSSGAKDFSVDAQRRMFIEKQALEKHLAEEARGSKERHHKRHHKSRTTTTTSSNRDDDDDDSIIADNNNHHDNDSDNDDEFSLDSEESVYVGIERADYTQPDNLALYGGNNLHGRSSYSSHYENEEGEEKKEDRLGISHVSIAIINRQQQQQQQQQGGPQIVLDWDADIPILHDEKSSSSLHEFMNGTTRNSAGDVAGKSSTSKKNVLVAMPLVGGISSNNKVGNGNTNLLTWNDEDHHCGKQRGGGEDSDTIDQVYQHKAAEGKMFIDEILSAITTTTSTTASTTIAIADAASSTMRSASVGGEGVGGGGTYPKLSPLQMYIPGIVASENGRGGKSALVEDNNFMRQMRERELRKEEKARVVERAMQEMREMIATADADITTDKADADPTGVTLVDANALMKKLEELMVE